MKLVKLNCHRFKILQQSEQATSNGIHTRSWKWYWTWSPGNFVLFKHMLTHTEQFQCLSNYATHLGIKQIKKEIQCTLWSLPFTFIFFALIDFHILVNAFSTNWKSCALPNTFLFLLLTQPQSHALKHTHFKWFWHPTTLHLIVKWQLCPFKYSK